MYGMKNDVRECGLSIVDPQDRGICSTEPGAANPIEMDGSKSCDEEQLYVSMGIQTVFMFNP